MKVKDVTPDAEFVRRFEDQELEPSSLLAALFAIAEHAALHYGAWITVNIDVPDPASSEGVTFGMTEAFRRKVM